MQRAWIVVDLGFGDSGKGTITDFLVRDKGAKLVVRFNGGAQAGHNVVTRDGRSHTFAQFGAGAFVPEVRTHLAASVVVHPSALLVEARHLEQNSLVHKPLDRLTIDEDARLITPFHQAANRVRELARGDARHGTCGVGVGETVRDALEHPDDVIVARDLRGRTRLYRQLERVRDRLWESLRDEVQVLGTNHPELAIFSDTEPMIRWMEFVRPALDVVVPRDWLMRTFRDEPSDVIFEGAQGVLLDENVGFHPHTTWSDCTFRGAIDLLQMNGFAGETTRVGVLRTYLTRHGEGPFPTEESGLLSGLPELHNASAGWQGTFRVGYPDYVLARYAVRVCGGIDWLALTHADRISAVQQLAVAYESERNETLFVHNERGQVVDVHEGDLAQQERLAMALRRIRPVLEMAPRRFDERLEHLEAAVGVAVRLISRGLTADDKVWRESSQ